MRLYGADFGRLLRDTKGSLRGTQLRWRVVGDCGWPADERHLLDSRLKQAGCVEVWKRLKGVGMGCKSKSFGTCCAVLCFALFCSVLF